MSLADIKDRTKAQMEAVAGIGIVHARMRFLRDLKDQDQLLKDGKLNAWFISREGSRLQDENVNQSRTTETVGLVIHGFYGVNDADDSETAFDALVDAVIAAVNADRRAASKLGGTVVTAEPPQLRMVDYRMFGMNQVLCHHAEISMQAVWRDIQ